MVAAPQRIYNVKKRNKSDGFNFGMSYFCVNCNYAEFVCIELSLIGFILFLIDTN